MKILIFVAVLLAGCVLADEKRIPSGLDYLSDEFIDAINDLGTTWRAETFPRRLTGSGSKI